MHPSIMKAILEREQLRLLEELPKNIVVCNEDDIKFDNIWVCVVTNKMLDGDYIVEWCEHYYDLGFTHIHILEDLNGRDDKLISIPYLKKKVDKGLMTIEEIPHLNQWDTYPAFYKNHGTEFDWCGIFDSDEFLNLHQHKTIQEFLSDPKLDFKKTDVVLVCWRYFDDNDQIYKKPGKVKERFTRLASLDNFPNNMYNGQIETKILIRGSLTNVRFFIGHCAISNNNDSRIKFCDGTVSGKFCPFHSINYDVASLDHYYCKSTEEFVERKAHGRLDMLDWSKEKALKYFKDTYYTLSKRTPEKDKIFEKKLHL